MREHRLSLSVLVLLGNIDENEKERGRGSSNESERTSYKGTSHN